MNLFQEAALVAGKDLRIEARSRVTIQQILPFGLIVCFSFWTDFDYKVIHHWTTENYRYVFRQPAYIRTMLATLWMAVAGLLFHAFYTGGIVETVGRAETSPADFWSASRRNFAHNAKCFALGAIVAAILLGVWLGSMGAAQKLLFESAPPHTGGRAAWTAATFLVAVFLFAAVALLTTLAKAARRGLPGIGALRGFRDARRRLRGRWLQGFGVLLFWTVAGAAALAVLFGAAWAQHTPSGPSVALNLVLLALSLAAIPAARVGAWGSLLALFDRAEEETQEAARQAVVARGVGIGVTETTPGSGAFPR